MVVEHEFDFARRHKEIRESRGLTQQQEAEMIGIDRNVVSNWEMGIAIPRTKMLPKICVALNCPPGDLLGMSTVPLTGPEYSLLKRYRDLNDAEWQKALVSFAETLCSLRSGSDG